MDFNHYICSANVIERESPCRLRRARQCVHGLRNLPTLYGILPGDAFFVLNIFSMRGKFYYYFFTGISYMAPISSMLL